MLHSASDFSSNGDQNDSGKRTPHHKNDTKTTVKINRNPPSLDKNAWEEINNEFLKVNEKSWKQFRDKDIEPEKFIEALNKSLAKYLKSKPVFQQEVKKFFHHKKPSLDPIEEMRKEKISLNKKAKSKNATEKDKLASKEGIRMYNYLLKLKKEKDEAKLAKEEEKAFRNDFWGTAKSVTNGTFGKENKGPTFNKSTADQYYKDKYTQPVNIPQEDLSWFPTVEKPSVPYNLKPYTPKDIKQALYKKSNTSDPGEDGVVYQYLKKCHIYTMF